MFGDEKYETRNLKLKGCEDEDWWWQAKDQGAWKGPHENWNGSHYDQYLDHTPERKLVVTAGGNMGFHVRAYASLFERVYAFEPDNDNFTALVRNCQYDNVYFFRAALGTKPGWGNICKLDNGNMGTHTMTEVNNKWPHDRDGEIPYMSIDQFDFPFVSLIQLDIEGGEPEAIAGAEQTLAKYHPTVITEGNAGRVRTILTKYGYTHEGQSASDYIYTSKEK